MMKKILTLFGILISAISFGQNVIMGDVGYTETNPADCSTFGVGANNFFDDGNAGNYSANFNDTTVFCPNLNLGTKMTLTFAINAGFEFDVDGSDSIYVYDGPNTSSPLLGVHNSVTDPNGFAYTASWSNPSGCLTVVFISDGALEGTGWIGNAQCGNPNQPFEPHVEAFVNGQGSNVLNPIDTGFVDVCFGDSILLVAKPLFPYSMENSTTGTYGYSQNVNNVDYEWNISDGGTYPNNDSIWFTPPTRNGFLVDLKITDAFPQIERILFKVRVSQLPSFAGTGPEEDTVCLGQNTNLIGGVTPTDTVGIDIPPGQFQLGGSFAGLTYLPDGSGAQYQAPISISGFPSGATVSNSQDLNQVCITIEHSYLGDLEIALQCPNGTQVPLVNSYSGGFIPGGTSGGGTFLGQPYDDIGGGGAGIGWEYCFSSVFNTIAGSMTNNLGNTVAVPGVPANPPTQPVPLTAGNSIDNSVTYEPEASFAGFAGCPINGQWTIIVQDNLGTDDGYIFEWGLYFDPSFFPGASSYQNYVVSESWQNDPTIVSSQDDTLIVVQPNTPGNYGYTYEITDDFGCFYDTTVFLYVLPLPAVQADTLGCDLGVQLFGTTSYSGGVWSAADTAITFDPNPDVDNPLVLTSTPGVYTITYTDIACGMDTSLVVTFPPYPYTEVSDTILCNGTPWQIYAMTDPVSNPSDVTYTWYDANYTELGTGQYLSVTDEGEYTVVIRSACGDSLSDVAIIDYKLCDIKVPNVISLSSTDGNNLWYVTAEGIATFECVIVNRWGNTIYEFDDVNGAWDGTTEGGKLVAEGTYFYRITATDEAGEEYNLHGFIQVVH